MCVSTTLFPCCCTDKIVKHTLCSIYHRRGRKLRVITLPSMSFICMCWPLRPSYYLKNGFTLLFTLRISYNSVRQDVGDVGFLWQPCLGRVTPCFESKIQHFVTSTDLFASLSPDLVGIGAGRAGEETKTEEQAGAGHRHNGPEQLRTIQHFHLLLLFTPPLHLSLPLAPLTQQTKLQPPTIRQTNCKRTEAVNCKMGEGGVWQRWAGLCTLTCVCVCVCLQPRTVCGLVSVWETATPDVFTHAYMEKHVNWQHLIIVDVGVCY